MPKGGKFGTMGGVFTPSILTILGVIMYMRLSWIVGNSGTLITTILIIMLAHIVSVTTGLSVSSVATDKKIKAGGIYYMLSRSLGFPIGGAIGVTIFVATALSISLYLIGFSESALQVTKHWFGIEQITINHLRILGTIALIAIVTIAYISTSIAIKTQYIILGLIAFSLISIFLGTAEGKGFDFSSISEGAEKVDFSVLFGIFFPAVTGFTAGVAMSGDLKNPKKSIPWGTMLAVITGLIVYLSLALFIYYNIPMAELQKNTNVLVEFGWIPQAVIAGIWGATLSSALGGILGGPRILQAMSIDSITPRFFAKGVGKNNEPRRALILTFVLAELGILIGELDVIAGIVAMFYMAAYMFINLSCFLEQWASPDFRPTFRIPLLISLIGAVATFLLMIQLDIVSALLSVLVMTIIFLWLTRKQLELGSGDVWQSVWSSVVKLGLKNLNKKETHQRNWEPNILLFSGGTEFRPHLLDFSKSIAGRNGMISNFDLIKNETANTLFPKHQQSLNAEGEADDSIFYRRQECKHIYQGIEAIAETYGFSGVEPNTILMGWAHNTENPKQFTHMTNVLHQLDYNILFLDFDKEKGFGNKKKIDIWWRDLSQVSYFTVQLSKFLLASKDWSGAEVRFIYLNNNNSAQHSIIKAVERITAELKDIISIEVINNEIEQKSFYEAVKILSYDADLIIIDLPHLTENNDEGFIDETNELLQVLGTTLIVKASSHFNKGKIVNLEFEKRYNTSRTNLAEISKSTLPELLQSKGVSLQNEIQYLDENVRSINKKFVHTVYDSIGKIYGLLTKTLEIHNKVDTHFFEDVDQLISDIQNNRIGAVENVLKEAIEKYLKNVESEIKKLSPKLHRFFYKEELVLQPEDSEYIRKFKTKWSKKGEKAKDVILLQKNAKKIYVDHYLSYLFYALNGIGSGILELDSIFKKWLQQIESKNTEELHKKELLQTLQTLIENQISQNRQYVFDELNTVTRKYSNSVLANSDKLLFGGTVFEKDKFPVKNKEKLISYSANFKQNTVWLLNQIKVNIKLLRVKQLVLPKIHKINTNIQKEGLQPIQKTIEEIVKNIQILTDKDFEKAENKLESLNLRSQQVKALQTIEDAEQKYLPILHSNIEMLTSLNHFSGNQIDLLSEKINVQRVVKYLTENEIMHEISTLLQVVINETSSELIHVENALKLLQFVYSADSKNEKNEKEIQRKALKELTTSQQRLQSISERLEQGIQRISSQCSELLTDEIICTRAEQLNGIIRQEKTRKGISKYVNSIKHIPENMRDKTDELLIKGSDLLTKSTYQHRFKEIENIHSKLRDYVDLVGLSKKRETQLPFYYYQLFAGKHKAPFEFLENRTFEIQRFKKAYQRFIHGGSGAVLFTGERYSGISYLIENLLKNHSFKNVYKIEPPQMLLADAQKTINKTFKTSTGINENADEILHKMTRNSVVVIEDIEKWWLRTEKGSEALHILINYIKKYNKKVLFLLSSNIHSYQVIRKIIRIDECLQETITLQPLKIEEIKKVILDLHKTSGMQIVWKGENEKNMSFRSENQLMKKITTISEGNIGFSFNVWLAMINDVKNNKLIFKNTIDKEFPQIPESWTNMLLQLLLHKELTLSQLYKIYKSESKEQTQQVLQSLLRTSLVKESEIRHYNINPFVLSHVVKYLQKKGLIN